jgi:hypothetical protein
MIDFDNMNFGDVVYVVNETNNAFSKKRITMIDENGFEWYRYDREQWEYSITQIVYCGRVEFHEFGEVRFDEDRQTELHFKFSDGQINSDYLDDVAECEEWFHTQEEAEAYIVELKEKRKVF